MDILETQLDISSPDYQENREAMLGLVQQWRQRVDLVKQGGGADATKKHKSRGKLTARERIEGLVDGGTAFLEFSTLAAWDVYESPAPGAGVVGRARGWIPRVS